MASAGRRVGHGFSVSWDFSYSMLVVFIKLLRQRSGAYTLKLYLFFNSTICRKNCLHRSQTVLEGSATVLVGVASFWMVFDFPDEAHFLSDIDRQRVIRRLKADQQSSAEHESFKMEYFWASVKDWKTWLYAIIYTGADGPLYAFSLFLPSIISAVSRPANSAAVST